MVTIVRVWGEARRTDGSIQVHDTSGKLRSARLHNSRNGEDWANLVGQVADLERAYDQLLRHVAHRCFSVVALMNEDGSASFFDALSLMCGRTAAIFAFLRFSSAISAVGHGLFNLLSVQFSDDLTELEPKRTGEWAQASLEAFLDLLGWSISNWEKRLPFKKQFVSLGVKL